jgi:hypothetical protein
MAHRTLSGAQAEAPHELAALGFSESYSAIIHRAVRCAPDCPVCTGLSGEPTEQRSTTPNGRLRWRYYNEQCRSQKSELPSQNAPDCPVAQEDKGLNGQPLQTPIVGWRGMHQAVNSVMSGPPPDCLMCPLTANLANG